MLRVSAQNGGIREIDARTMHRPEYSVMAAEFPRFVRRATRSGCIARLAEGDPSLAFTSSAHLSGSLDHEESVVSLQQSRTLAHSSELSWLLTSSLRP